MRSATAASSRASMRTDRAQLKPGPNPRPFGAELRYRFNGVPIITRDTRRASLRWDRKSCTSRRTRPELNVMSAIHARRSATLGALGWSDHADQTSVEYYRPSFYAWGRPSPARALAGSDDGSRASLADGRYRGPKSHRPDMANYTRVVRERTRFSARRVRRGQSHQLDDFRPYLWRDDYDGRGALDN